MRPWKKHLFTQTKPTTVLSQPPSSNDLSNDQYKMFKKYYSISPKSWGFFISCDKFIFSNFNKTFEKFDVYLHGPSHVITAWKFKSSSL